MDPDRNKMLRLGIMVIAFLSFFFKETEQHWPVEEKRNSRLETIDSYIAHRAIRTYRPINVFQPFYHSNPEYQTQLYIGSGIEVQIDSMCVSMQVCLKRFWLVRDWEASGLRGARLAVLGRDNVMDGTVLNYKVFSNRDRHTNTCLPEKANTEMCLEWWRVQRKTMTKEDFQGRRTWAVGVTSIHQVGNWCSQEPRIQGGRSGALWEVGTKSSQITWHF